MSSGTAITSPSVERPGGGVEGVVGGVEATLSASVGFVVGWLASCGHKSDQFLKLGDVLVRIVSPGTNGGLGVGTFVEESGRSAVTYDTERRRPHPQNSS